MDWFQYLTTVVRTFRQRFESLTPDLKKVIRERFFERTFLQPCQIEVLDSGLYSMIFLIVHDRELMDMKFTIHRNARSSDVSEFAKRYPHISENKQEITKLLGSKSELVFIYMDRARIAVALGREPAKVAESFLRTLVLEARSILKSQQFDTFKTFFGHLQESISKVPQKEIRTELTETSQKLDELLKEMKHVREHERKLAELEEDIGGVRQLIGVSQVYQDWRVLASDVETLKKTPRVSKEIFDSEIKRLDQRIDALREIRFWSKRTIVDILLAVVATASTIIAALLAAGVVQF